MFIARRASGRLTADFPVGSHVTARPATVTGPIIGVVIASTGDYTLTLRADDFEIVVDVEDCSSSE